MCAIAGILNAASRRPVDRDLLAEMSRTLAHRGPDGDGLWTGEGVGFVHRRIAVIDPRSGQQPMHSAHGTLHVVFNGEIYNYRELRRGLESRGHRFRTQSDTEV